MWTDLITLHFNAILLDIHAKHLRRVLISNRFLPYPDSEPSYTPTAIGQLQRPNVPIERDQLTNNSGTA